MFQHHVTHNLIKFEYENCVTYLNLFPRVLDFNYTKQTLNPKITKYLLEFITGHSNHLGLLPNKKNVFNESIFKQNPKHEERTGFEIKDDIITLQISDAFTPTQV